MLINRRRFLVGLGGVAALVAAPTLVRAANIMPVRALSSLRYTEWGINYGRMPYAYLLTGKPEYLDLLIEEANNSDFRQRLLTSWKAWNDESRRPLALLR